MDSVEDPLERFQNAVKGVFAGNIFDLGAPKMVALAEQGISSGEMFKNARATLVQRPWAVDKFDELSERFGPGGGLAHKKALVFADNAGVATTTAHCIVSYDSHASECETACTEVITLAHNLAIAKAALCVCCLKRRICATLMLFLFEL